MDDQNRQDGAGQEDAALPDAPADIHAPADDTAASPEEDFDDSLMGEIGALIDDGRTYAEAEIAFQKTRAKLAGRTIGVAAGSLVLAIILLHIALLALAVGLVIALAPLVTIWGAIAIVVGGLLAGMAFFVWVAAKSGSKVSGLFAASSTDDAS
jgi:hypothetical protein